VTISEKIKKFKKAISMGYGCSGLDCTECPAMIKDGKEWKCTIPCEQPVSSKGMLKAMIRWLNDYEMNQEFDRVLKS